MEKRRFLYVFNPKDNGGECVSFEYTISPACETEAIIEACCYGVSTSIIKILL